jgi:hypothetical protein
MVVTVTCPDPPHLIPTWSETKLGDDYGLIMNANGVVAYQKGYTGDLKYFEGVDFTYGCHDVDIATGTIVQDNMTAYGTTAQVDVLFHNSTDPTPMYFDVPTRILPPGKYLVSVKMKTSEIVYDEVVKITAFIKPQTSELTSKTINGRAFIRPDTWRVFTFTFQIEEPTFVEFTADVTNSTDVSFYSFNISQISGGVKP